MDMIDEYNKIKESPDYKELLRLIQQLNDTSELNVADCSNLGFELGQFYHLFQNRPNVVHTISPKDVKIIQNRLGNLLKALTNFQSGFSKGFESATDKEIVRKYCVKES